jgi:hypothetical protein
MPKNLFKLQVSHIWTRNKKDTPSKFTNLFKVFSSFIYWIFNIPLKTKWVLLNDKSIFKFIVLFIQESQEYNLLSTHNFH